MVVTPLEISYHPAGKKVSFVIQGAIGEVKSGAFRGE
jgi:hypothetical protein